MGDPHIEIESQIISRIGYSYQIWKTKGLGGRSKRICVRCAVHSFNKSSDENMNLYALHEWNTSRQLAVSPVKSPITRTSSPDGRSSQCSVASKRCASPSFKENTTNRLTSTKWSAL